MEPHQVRRATWNCHGKLRDVYLQNLNNLFFPRLSCKEKLLREPGVSERGRVCQQVEHPQLRLPDRLRRQKLRTRQVSFRLTSSCSVHVSVSPPASLGTFRKSCLEDQVG